MTETANARFLQTRGGVATVVLGAVMLSGLVGPTVARGAQGPSLREVTELSWMGEYLTRQPVHPRYIARPLDGTLMADSFRGLSQPSHPARMPESSVARSADVPVVRWVLSAIMITESRRVAVVNDSLVTVGAAVGSGATVAAIEPDRVILLESGGTRRELRVQSGSQQ